MITRQVPGGSKDAFVAEAAVDLATALKIVTLNGAISMGIADKTGSIEKNKSADFIVLDKNPFDVDTYQIHKIKVLSTVFRGSEVYAATDK
jgi:predicted amidohydrolase YtcJ